MSCPACLHLWHVNVNYLHSIILAHKCINIEGLKDNFKHMRQTVLPRLLHDTFDGMKVRMERVIVQI